MIIITVVNCVNDPLFFTKLLHANFTWGRRQANTVSFSRFSIQFLIWLLNDYSHQLGHILYVD